eukprot:1578878-Rhodomonas_salina.1
MCAGEGIKSGRNELAQAEAECSRCFVLSVGVKRPRLLCPCGCGCECNSLCSEWTGLCQTKEEWKGVAETNKILNTTERVSPPCLPHPLPGNEVSQAALTLMHSQCMVWGSGAHGQQEGVGVELVLSPAYLNYPKG